MASPFLVTSLGNVNGLPFSTQNRVGYLHDGSVLVAANSGAAVCSLYQITNPGAINPTIGSALSQTFTVASSTILVVDLLCIPGSGTTDIWVAFASDGGAGQTVNVAHATYNGSTFNWDNTGTVAVTASATVSAIPSIAWNGTNLIVVYRDQITTWFTQIVWTATKNGSGGWAAAAHLSASSSGTHAFQLLRHDTQLAGGVGGTVCIYITNAGNGVETFQAQVLLDSAASAAVANWGSAVAGTGTQSTASALISACVDPANGKIHVIWSSATSVIGVNYQPVTVTSGGVPTWGTRVTVNTTVGTGTVGIGVDVASRVYAFYATGAIGSAGVVRYRTSDAPYTSFSTANSTVGNTAGDGFPHIPSHDQAMSTYIPLLFQRGTATFNAEYDNTIVAQSAIGSFSPPLTFVPRVNLARYRSMQAYMSPQNKAYPMTVSGPNNFTQSFTAALGFTGNLVKTTAKNLGTAALSFAGNFQIGPGLFWSQEIQSNISGGPPGNNSTQTTLTWTDASGNGWAVGMLPAYGGALVSPRYEINSGVRSVEQTSLSTSNPDGFIHLLANNAGVFTGTEDPTYTLTEIAPIPTTPNGIWVRRYYDSGTIQPSTGPALQYRVRVCFQPGDPGFFYDRIDITNPSASPVTLAGTDGLEIAMIGGMTQANQPSSSAWIPGNGFYANVAGTETAWPGPEPTTTVADPDYVFITPTVASGLNLALFCVRAKASNGGQSIASLTGASNAQITYLTNANRLKVKVRVDMSSFPGSTTMTLYYLEAMRRSYATGEASSMAADYLNPDGAGAFTTGTFSSYSLDEGAYVVAAASNKVVVTHTFPTNVAKRWLPSYKITSYTASGSPKVNLAGTNLVWGTDYISVVDTSNQIAYVKLLKVLVASGAGAGQLNNGALTITPNSVFAKALTAVLSFAGAITKQTNTNKTATLSFTGAQTRSTSKRMIATLSFTGPTNLLNSITKGMTAALSFTGPTHLTNLVTKTLPSATLSFVGAITKQTNKVLTAANLTFSGAMTTSKVFLQSFVASLGFAGNLTKSTSKSLAASLGFTGSLNIADTLAKAISGVARIIVIANQTITGQARITATASQIVTGKTRITITTNKTITGVANIVNNNTIFKPLKSLVLDFDNSYLGTTLGLHGDTIPLQIITSAPTGTPPGNLGLLVQVTAGVVTIWVWDGTAWRSK